MNHTPSTHSSKRWIVRWTAASLSAMALLLASQEIPAAAQSRDAYAATSSTVRHWGTFFGGANTFKPEDMTTSPASVNLPGSVAEVATSNWSQYVLLTNGGVYAWGLGNGASWATARPGTPSRSRCGCLPSGGEDRPAAH